MRRPEGKGEASRGQGLDVPRARARRPEGNASGRINNDTVVTHSAYHGVIVVLLLLQFGLPALIPQVGTSWSVVLTAELNTSTRSIYCVFIYAHRGSQHRNGTYLDYLHLWSNICLFHIAILFVSSIVFDLAHPPCPVSHDKGAGGEQGTEAPL